MIFIFEGGIFRNFWVFNWWNFWGIKINQFPGKQPLPWQVKVPSNWLTHLEKTENIQLPPKNGTFPYVFSKHLAYPLFVCGIGPEQLTRVFNLPFTGRAFAASGIGAAWAWACGASVAWGACWVAWGLPTAGLSGWFEFEVLILPPSIYLRLFFGNNQNS